MTVRTHSLHLLALLAATVLVAPRPAYAQGTSRECQRAARIVEKGHPARRVADASALLAICGAVGANAVAAGMATYTQETDTVALDTFMRSADLWRDAAVMDAATQLATDASATPQARVFAVRHLLILTHPYLHYGYSALATGSVTTTESDGTEVTTLGCTPGIGSESADRVGTPLPADYADRIQATLQGLITSATTPAAVRNAARCSR